MENKKQDIITEEELTKSNTIIEKLKKYYSDKIVGQTNLGNALLVALMANGHILLESVPGLAKTTAAKVLTEAVIQDPSTGEILYNLPQEDMVALRVTFRMGYAIPISNAKPKRYIHIA